MARTILDVIGAEPATFSRAILIRVRDPAGIARQQGAIASLATAVLPSTVEARVYDEMARRLGSDLRANGVDADVTVVADTGRALPPARATDGPVFVRGMAMGAGAVGAGWLLWRLLLKPIFGG